MRRGSIPMVPLVVFAVVAAILVGWLRLHNDGTTTFGAGTSPAKAAPVTGSEAAALAHMPKDYRDLYVEAGQAYHVNPLLLAAIYMCENGNVWHSWNYPWSTSSAEAKGPMQFIDPTWASYETPGRHDVNNMVDAVYATANMAHQFGLKASSPLGSLSDPLRPGTMLRFAAEYNAGPGVVNEVMPLATKYYVSNVTELFASNFTRSGEPNYGDPVNKE